MSGFSQEFVGLDCGSLPALPALARSDAAGIPTHSRYEAHAHWGGTVRQFEAGETTRLNAAHWARAQDTPLNEWLRERLSTIRARVAYESRNNGMLAGVLLTVVDDVVGPDGPMLSVQSSDDAYNDALETVWRKWFYRPTFRPHLSGAGMLKLWLRTLCRAGEFLAVMANDPTAEGPVKMRLRLRNPRRLGTPGTLGLNDRHVMGIDFDGEERPARYWISERSGLLDTYVPHSPDDVIHEFLVDEEEQARGYPWLAPSLPSIADTRDFDDQIMDAARSMADASGLLYTDSPDAPVWNMPESTKVERRTYKMAPPGWKPWNYPATAPPVQYPDYRSERHREMGRPLNMPLLIVRYDASRHNYSSARFDSQGWYRTVEGVQNWLSGTPESCGTLNRLVDLVGAEARFSIPALRKRPDDVEYLWTWSPRPHVDATKEADAETIGLETGTTNLIDTLAARGTTLQRHLRAMQRIVREFEAAGIPLPSWFHGSPQASEESNTDADAREKRATKEARDKEEPVNAN